MENNSKFYSEPERIRSFANWQNEAVAPEELARAGFYYLRGDRVKCPFCNGEVWDWKPEDDPLDEHVKISPRCPFLTKSFDDEPAKNHLSAITITQSKYPEYSLKEKRVNSFINWPKTLRQKPIELASSGLFYNGKGDQTFCFYCGQDLENWEENDDVWVEHARHSPRCSYLLLHKGEEFVSRIQSVERTHSDLGTIIRKPEEEIDKDEAEEGEKSTAGLCKICYQQELEVVFVPCRHLVACIDCTFRLKNECPVCRKRFDKVIRAFIS